MRPTVARVTSNAPATVGASPAAAATQVYRVGVRDVLDIHLVELANGNSTLFTVLPGGMLEYPLAGMSVSGGRINNH